MTLLKITPATRRIAWFVGLWAASVMVLGLVAFLIKLFL